MIEELVKRYPVLESVKGQIEDAYKILETCYEDGGKLLIAGNGGSAADSDHIVGELMKGFVKRRPVSAELAEALKQADPERGEELAKKPEYIREMLVHGAEQAQEVAAKTMAEVRDAMNLFS